MSVLKVTGDNFEQEILNSEQTVLLDFWAPWCGPCKMLSPIVDEAAEEIGAGVKIGKVNVDEEKELAKKYQVLSIPTLVVLKNGKADKRAVGVQTKEFILDMVK